jgi:hypothetical protein
VQIHRALITGHGRIFAAAFGSILGLVTAFFDFDDFLSLFHEISPPLFDFT